MKTSFVIIGVAILAIAGWLLISKTGQHQNMVPGSTITQKTPDFHLQDYRGAIVSFSDFAGKPMVINSWAAWCPFCRQEQSCIIQDEPQMRAVSNAKGAPIRPLAR